MVAFPESEKSDERSLPIYNESIKRLYVQIRKMPELTEQARIIDQVLVDRLQELKATALVVVNQLNKQKKHFTAF